MGSDTRSETRAEQLEGADRQNTPTVGVNRAMRARDVSRPTADDVADALARLGRGRPADHRKSAEGKGGNSPVSS
jgi:hypothetical protein